MYISEQAGEFKPHTNLLDDPFIFETPYVKGCIYYLAAEGGLGGDSFIIKGDDSLTVSLLADMAGEGVKGRKKIQRFLDYFERIVERGLESTFEKKMIYQDFINLDQKVDPDALLALSFVRTELNKRIYYSNHGENTILVCKNGETQNYSELPEWKIGLFKFMPDQEELARKTSVCSADLSSGDRVLLCTDGVLEYFGDFSAREKRISSLMSGLSSGQSLEEFIREINISTNADLHNRKRTRVADDYTIICVEMR